MKVRSDATATVGAPDPSRSASVVRARSTLTAGLLAIVLGVLFIVFLGPPNGSAFGVTTPAINQCNGVDNVGGQAVSCTVTVTNNLNLSTGVTSSTVTGTSCSGAANAGLTCIPWSTGSNQLATSVTQCNGSGSGGGGTVNCTVDIVNNITGVSTTTPATVNQCNESAEGGGTQPTLICNPTGVTTNATVTQCNQSGNGGGGTMRVRCSVTTSTQTSAVPIVVNQCVGSGNGGGSTVTCTVSITNNILSSGGTTGTSGGTTGGTTGSGGGTTGTGTGTSGGTTGGTTGSGGGTTGTGTGTSGRTTGGTTGSSGGTTGTGTGTSGGTTGGTTGSGGGTTGTGTVAGPTSVVVKSAETPVVTTSIPPVVPSAVAVHTTGSLAFTGADTEVEILLALFAIALGALLVATSRRPRRHNITSSIQRSGSQGSL